MKYTDAQREAIVTTGKHLCVRAGAGSGKTRVLIDRIIHLIEHDRANLGEIVAITFTRKAAAEMRNRLREECQKRVSPDDSEIASKWINALHDIDTARITTIDSFCSGLLRDYGLWAQDDPEFAMMSESDSITLPRQIAEQEIGRLAKEENPEVDFLIQTLGMNESLDVITGALSRPLQRKHLSECLEQDEESLIEGWWAIVIESIRDLAPAARKVSGASGNPETQYEKFCDELLACCAEVERGQVNDAWWARIEALANFGFRGKRNSPDADPDEVDALKNFCSDTRKGLSAIIENRTNPEVFADSARLTRAAASVMQQVYAAYQVHKRTHSLKDFTDLLEQSVELIRSETSIRDRIARSIRYLMIDEFQDTNAAQWSLASGLMKTDTQEGPELFIVGDAKQSIYRFRNAQVEVFQRAQEEVDHLIELNTNFRSTPNVMDGINHFFRVSDSLAKVAQPWVPLETHNEAEDAAGVTVLLSEFAKGDNVSVQRQNESAAIAKQIHRIVESDQGIQYKNIAILFRKKSSMYLYENALRWAGIPFETFGGNRFFFRQEIADLMNALHVVHDPWNEQALLGFLRSPMVALDDNSILHLGWRRGLADNVYGDRELPDPVQQDRLMRGREILLRFRTRDGGSAAQVIEKLIQETQFESVLITLPHGKQRVNNVRKILDIAREMSRNGRPHVYQFLKYFEEQTTHKVIEEDAPHYGERSDAVSLMTVHASKGLEFPVVILADLGAQLGGGNQNSRVAHHDASGIVVVPPTHGVKKGHAVADVMRTRNKQEEEAEDARVLYVAMTRAERKLVLSASVCAGDGDAANQFEEFKRGSVMASIDSVFGVLDGAYSGKTRIGAEDGIELVLGSTLERGTAVAADTRDEKPLMIPKAEQYMPFSSDEVATNRMSVTEWLNGRFPVSEVAEGFNLAQYTALTRGTMTHAYLEAWDFCGLPPNALEFVEIHYPQLAYDSAWAEYLEAVATRLQDSELFTLLKDGAPLQKELPFVVEEAGCWISGTIDVLTESGVIIDYKTGAHRNGDQLRYEAQLQLYAHAIETLTGKSPSAGWLYYVESGAMESITLR